MDRSLSQGFQALLYVQGDSHGLQTSLFGPPPEPLSTKKQEGEHKFGSRALRVETPGGKWSSPRTSRMLTRRHVHAGHPVVRQLRCVTSAAAPRSSKRRSALLSIGPPRVGAKGGHNRTIYPQKNESCRCYITLPALVPGLGAVLFPGDTV